MDSVQNGEDLDYRGLPLFLKYYTTISFFMSLTMTTFPLNELTKK